MSILPTAEEQGQGSVGSLPLGSPPAPPCRGRGDEAQGGLAFLLLSSQAPATVHLPLPRPHNGDEDKQGLPHLRLGSRTVPAPMLRLHRGDEDQGGLAYLLLGSPTAPMSMQLLHREDEDKGGVPYLLQGSPPAPPTPTPSLPSREEEEGGAAPPAAEGSLRAATSRMLSGDLEQGGTAYLPPGGACDDSTPWWCALGAMGLVMVGLLLLNWCHVIG
ncbi:hypothetical protein AAC387_Pa04g0482 [Persea americana]